MDIKKLLLCFSTLIVLLSAVCTASPIPENRFAIGGIAPNSSPNYVKSIYGLPSERKSVPSAEGGCIQWSYNGTFIISFVDNVVKNITVKANNGIATADGIHVGSTVADLKAAYGEPIRIRYIPDNNKVKHMYYYYEMQGTPYYAMYFKFNEKNEIIEYTFGIMDGVPFSQQR